MAILKRLPGSARRYVDIETGVEYSRRQADALRQRQGQRKQRDKRAAVSHKYKLYLQLRDDYIDKKKQEGIKLTKKQAMQSDELKKIVKDLKSKDPFKKLSALKKTTRRDGIPDTIPVGETPAVYSEAA